MKNSAAKKIRQVPAGYLVVGVDPHKKRHAAVAITQDFAVHGKFKFNNSREGFMMTLERVRVEMTKTGSRGVIFAIETGGHYWRHLACLHSLPGYPIGRVKVNRLPLPGPSLSTHILPPCISTILLVTGKPSPVPGVLSFIPPLV